MDQTQPPRTGGETQHLVKEAAQTAKERTRELGDEVARQAQNVTGQVRERLSGEVQSQNERLATTLRTLSDELETMGKNAPTDSMAGAMVQRISEGSRQAADYLRAHGPEGVLQEVQEFARRKPGTFLLTSAVAGFVVGRLGKGLLTGGSSNGAGNGSRSAYATGSEYPTGPAYPDESTYTTESTYATGSAYATGTAAEQPAAPLATPPVTPPATPSKSRTAAAKPTDPAMAQRNDIPVTDRDLP